MRFHTGQSCRATVRVDAALVSSFVALSGDTNPVHVDAETAQRYGYARPVAHGAILIGVLSRLIGTELPGVGAIWMDQNIRWVRPVFVGDTVTVEVVVSAVSTGGGILRLAVVASNEDGETVMEGTANVKAAEPVGAMASHSQATVALVTGGGGGIGGAVASRLAAAGIDVALTYHTNRDAVEASAMRVRDAGRACTTHEADLARTDWGEHLCSAVLSAHGHVDVVIHTAAPRVIPKPIAELSRADFDEHWNVGPGAAIDLVRLWSPGMIQRGFGRFIFIGTSALEGAHSKGWAPYLSAKHALRGFMRSAAFELGASGITCNLVSPGLTITELTSTIPARIKEVEARRNPMRRLPTPADTAALVAFLAGPEAGFINGADLPVDGGMPTLIGI